MPFKLPIVEIYPNLVTQLQRHAMVLLQAPPGAGKSTWLPLQLIRDGHFNHILMLEPRRLAARNIAQYLALCQNERLGESIGLRIRQEKIVSSQTKLEIITDGILTRMLQRDPELNGIDCIIFDEFHERSMNVDLALALALESQSIFREDLKILLMSATLDARSIIQKWQCPVISSQGRSFPIGEVYHSLRDGSRWLYEMPRLIHQAITEQQGSCLVFLPGRREIDFVAKQLLILPLDASVEVFSLYGEQDKQTQQAAIAPAAKGRRKIVLATNVAETSLTIEGIRIVVDCGKRRSARYHLKTGVVQLDTLNISMSSAIQRAGRAGRIEPGMVYRLGSEAQFKHRPAHDSPEILNTDISQLILEAKQWGSSIEQLKLLDQPSLAQKESAINVLKMLGAVDDSEKITELGRQLLRYGTDIRWANMLVSAKTLMNDYPNAELSAVYVLALLESRVSQHADVVEAVQQQLQRPHPRFSQQLNFWLKRTKLKNNKHIHFELLPILLALAYPDRIAKKRGKGYFLANGAGVKEKDSVWGNNEYIAIADLGGKNGEHIFLACGLNVNLLEQLLPHYFSCKIVCEFDELQQKFIHEKHHMLGAIIVTRQRNGNAIDASLRVDAWLGLIRKHGFNFFADYARQSDNACSQLLIRMNVAAQLFPDQFSDASEPRLIETIEQWLMPSLYEVKNVQQLKKFPIQSVLIHTLEWKQQQQLDELLPKTLVVPTGSNICIQYQLDGPAKLSVRMQEIFGLSKTPSLAQGKLALLMDLLSPAHRSLQLTQDLGGFWKSSYKEIQKEMKGRYPKHFWPDDPASAMATTRVRSKM